MAYIGEQNGIRIYDYLIDVPDEEVMSGRDFAVINPPADLIQNKGGTYKKGNSIDPVTWAAIAYMTYQIILIALVGTIIVLTLQQVAYLFRGRPGQKIDENMFEGGDGSIWVRDPVSGEWERKGGASFDLIIFAFIAVFLIGIVILVFMNRKKIFGANGIFGTGKDQEKPKPKKKEDSNED